MLIHYSRLNTVCTTKQQIESPWLPPKGVLVTLHRCIVVPLSEPDGAAVCWKFEDGMKKHHQLVWHFYGLLYTACRSHLNPPQPLLSRWHHPPLPFLWNNSISSVDDCDSDDSRDWRGTTQHDSRRTFWLCLSSGCFIIFEHEKVKYWLAEFTVMTEDTPLDTLVLGGFRERNRRSWTKQKKNHEHEASNHKWHTHTQQQAEDSHHSRCFTVKCMWAKG